MAATWPITAHFLPFAYTLTFTLYFGPKNMIPKKDC